MQSDFATVSSNCLCLSSCIVSSAVGLFFLPLCDMYVTTTNRLHTGPESQTHVIVVPTCPLLMTFAVIRFDRSIATPAAGSACVFTIVFFCYFTRCPPLSYSFFNILLVMKFVRPSMS